jgi:hypothetical protein
MSRGTAVKMSVSARCDTEAPEHGSVVTDSDDGRPHPGIYAYGQKMEDMFTDIEGRIINDDYFAPVFERVGLPLELARECLDDVFHPTPAEHRAEPVFIEASALLEHERIPRFDEAQDLLVPASDVADLQLRNGFGTDGYEKAFKRSSCVFVSHRWQTRHHPDPDGAQLDRIRERLAVCAPEQVYLWIDYCCLPQRDADAAPDDDAVVQARKGLRRLASIVMSSDLMVIDSEDYLSRAWCHVELVTWLCTIASMEYLYPDDDSGLFDTVLTRHLHGAPDTGPDPVWDVRKVLPNLRVRGFTGDGAAVLELYKPLQEYCGAMRDSISYNMSMFGDGFDNEYLPHLVNLMCYSWVALKELDVSVRDDLPICLQVLVDALKFPRMGGG